MSQVMLFKKLSDEKNLNEIKIIHGYTLMSSAYKWILHSWLIDQLDKNKIYDSTCLHTLYYSKQRNIEHPFILRYKENLNKTELLDFEDSEMTESYKEIIDNMDEEEFWSQATFSEISALEIARNKLEIV